MSTHAITKFVEEDDEVVCAFYTHCDGYPTGHGKDLKEFLKDFVITAGLCISKDHPTANGAGCLAAQVVKHFKDAPGHTYMINPNCKWSTSYTYTIKAVADKPIILLVESLGETLYDGPIKDYEPKKDEDES